MRNQKVRNIVPIITRIVNYINQGIRFSVNHLLVANDSTVRITADLTDKDLVSVEDMHYHYKSAHTEETEHYIGKVFNLLVSHGIGFFATASKKVVLIRIVNGQYFNKAQEMFDCVLINNNDGTVKEIYISLDREHVTKTKEAFNEFLTNPTIANTARLQDETVAYVNRTDREIKIIKNEKLASEQKAKHKADRS